MGSHVSIMTITWKACHSLGLFPMFIFPNHAPHCSLQIICQITSWGELFSSVLSGRVEQSVDSAQGHISFFQCCQFVLGIRQTLSILLIALLPNLICCLSLCGVTGPHGQDSRDCGGGHDTKSVMISLVWLMSTLVQHVVQFPLDLFSLVNLTCLICDFPFHKKTPAPTLSCTRRA